MYRLVQKCEKKMNSKGRGHLKKYEHKDQCMQSETASPNCFSKLLLQTASPNCFSKLLPILLVPGKDDQQLLLALLELSSVSHSHARRSLYFNILPYKLGQTSKTPLLHLPEE